MTQHRLDDLIPNYSAFHLYHPDAQMSHKKITFLGAGNMAAAMIRGMIAKGYPAHLITVSAPSVQNSLQLKKLYGVNTTSDNQEAISDAEVVVLATKPQMMKEVAAPLQSVALSRTLLISIMAGMTISRLQELWPNAHHIIRTMPNTPTFIGKGMTGIYAPQNLPIEYKIFTQALMESMGEVCWVEAESQMNAVIAAAGSAPAYFFYIMEAMQAAAIELGVSKEQARSLVQYAAIGAASMVQENSDIDISVLRHNVMSKGGTTEQAIAKFENAKLDQILQQGMNAAYHRAIEMEQLF